MGVARALSFPRLTLTQLLQAAFLSLLILTVTLNAFLPSTPRLLGLLSDHKLTAACVAWCVAISTLAYQGTRPRPVLLLDYSCYLPGHDRRCSFEACEYFVRRVKRFSQKSEDFMRGIYHKSGLGDETYAPAFIFGEVEEADHRATLQEAEEGMFAAVDSLLSKCDVNASLIDTVVVTCGMFAPEPSLSSILVNRYGFKEGVKTYNLGGMGCSSGVMSIDMAARILNASSTKILYALVVVTECIGPNWYFGDDRSMLVTNCIFRVGCAAAILTNDPTRRKAAKMELARGFRTHHGADDSSYRAAFQFEDEDGHLGVSLKKDLIRVAGEGLKEHIRSLAPRVLPISQLLIYAYHVSKSFCSKNLKQLILQTRSLFPTPAAADEKEVEVPPVASSKPYVPDFTTAFEHICVHTGGKAVIESVARVMRLDEDVTEPARMTLHRFGNTSSSLVFYELAYFEAKGRVRAGDRMWVLAFGTGFKVCSLVWKALRDSTIDSDNPWKDTIHRYPLKAW